MKTMATRQTDVSVFYYYEDESHRGYCTTLNIYIPSEVFKHGPERLQEVADEFRAQLLKVLEIFYYSKEGSEYKW